MTTVLSAEWVDPEHYLGPRMKKITFECAKCGHIWTRKYKAEPRHDPACPSKSCSKQSEMDDLRRQVANLTAMLESNSAPATIGQNIRVKAVDETARIVMEDQNMTNLKDNIRMGETMAPPLPPAQQKRADTLFSAAAANSGNVPVLNASGGPARSISNKRLQAVGQRAIRGAYRGNSVSPTSVLPKERPAAIQVKNERYDASRPTAEKK